MAATRSTTRTASQSYRRQALIWLIATLLLGVFTALVWMFSQTPAMGAKIENAPISAPQTLSTELKQPLKIESLHELDTDVQPISFDATVRDLRSYPDEFKDKRYLLANKGKWTVQVMNVAENDVIASYLEGREDRNKFAYFRYLDDNEQVRYMLTYGLMSSPQEAVGAAKLIDFKLPANVRVLPEEINRYVSIIDNYERPDPVKDLSAKRTRSVNLRPTKREVPIRQQTNNNTDQAASNTANRNAQDAANAESIRQSVDTSETLSVNEERIVGTEEQGATTSAPKNTDTNAPKKPPVVATPKPPAASANNGNSNNANPNSANPDSANANSKNQNTGSANKNSNSNAKTAAAPKDNSKGKSAAVAKENSDTIKELIEEKSN